MIRGLRFGREDWRARRFAETDAAGPLAGRGDSGADSRERRGDRRSDGRGENLCFRAVGGADELLPAFAFHRAHARACKRQIRRVAGPGLAGGDHDRGCHHRSGCACGCGDVGGGAGLFPGGAGAGRGIVEPAPGATSADRQFPIDGSQPFRLLVVDEYQWLADPDRGNHYEGVLLSVPPTVQLLLLSGNVANPEEVVSWLQRLGRNVEIIQHRDRPVPLEEVEVDDLIHGLPRSIEGFWSRRVAGALREGLGPVLVFAPHRQDAERLARQFARELPLADPLPLTPEQENLLGPAAREGFEAAGGLPSQRADLRAAGRHHRAPGQGRAAPRGRRHAGTQRRHQFLAAVRAHHRVELPVQPTGARDRAARAAADDRAGGPARPR